MREKNKLVNVRCSEKDRDKWQRMAQARGEKLGKIIRRYLDRLCEAEEQS